MPAADGVIGREDGDGNRAGIAIGLRALAARAIAAERQFAAQIGRLPGMAARSSSVSATAGVAANSFFV